MRRGIVIQGAGVMSALGKDFAQVKQRFAWEQHAFERREFDGCNEWVAPLGADEEAYLESIRSERNLYRELDRTALMAIAAARGASLAAGWKDHQSVGVVMGSSRGATGIFEKQHTLYLNSLNHKVNISASPTTTLGNIATSVAQDLLCGGIDLSHSITCSTALHSMINAIAWIEAGMGTQFLVGGSEAALTGFTLSQMKALRIYTSRDDQDFPCRPHEAGDSRANTFALGEGAVVFAIEPQERKPLRRGLALIEGIGWGVEGISSLTGMSVQGESFVAAMSRALEQCRSGDPIDVIITHAPGTRIGDRAESEAIAAVFGDAAPLQLSPKWQIGHTFGASGAFGILYAIALLQGNPIVLPAYRKHEKLRIPTKVSRVMVNAAGFGGNACSVVLSTI